MVRIPVITTLGIEEFSGGEISVPQSLVTNGIFSQRSREEMYVTQRPSVDMTEVASDTVSLSKGRGIYYWDTVNSLYFVNDNKVYKGAYSQEVTEAAVTVSDIDGAGGTATVTTATATTYKVGDKVTFVATPSGEFDGEQTITAVNSTTEFEFATTSTVTNDSGSATRSLGGGGNDRIYFFELGSNLVIIDQEDNTGWYITSAASTVLVEITDAGFPGVNASLELANGGAVLDGTLYVMDTTGTIAGSDVEDPITWSSLNFKNAEVEPDGGVMLAKHNTHLAAFGNRSIEFFYNAANPTGSPLNVRQDMSHEIGAVNASTVWGDQNSLFFVSQSKTGGLSVYVMNSFTLTDISTHDIDSFLTSAVYVDDRKLVASGFSIGHTIFYVLTVYYVDDDIVPLESIVFNSSTSTWTRFELMHDGINDCPIMDWTVATKTRIGQGILSTGDIITATDDWRPYDTVGGSGGIFESGVFELNVFTSGRPSGGTPVSMEIITGHSDSGTVNRKFMSSLRAAGPRTKESQDLLVQWSNETNTDYNTGKTLDTSIPGQRINRLGSYRQRNFKLTYAGTERIELDALEAEMKTGMY